MNESDHRIIKGPEAVALDDVTRGTRELLEVYRILVEDLAGHELHALLERHQADLSAAFGQLIATRQAAGELPDVGDIEHAQWRSLGLRIKGILSQEPEAGILAREAATESRALAKQIEAVQTQHPSPAVREALMRLAELVNKQADTLEKTTLSLS